MSHHPKVRIFFFIGVVSDPRCLQSGSGSSLYISADPDPDPGQTLPSLEVQFLHEKYTYFMLVIIGHEIYVGYVGTKAFSKGWKSGLLCTFY
jgi:hypothetical protein